MKKTKILFSAAVIAVMTFAMSLVAVAATAPTVTTPTAVVGNEAKSSTSYTYTEADAIESYYSGIVIPVKVNASGLFIVEAQNVTVGKNMSFELYTDPACQNRFSYVFSVNAPGSYKKEIQVPGKATYYLKVSSYMNGYDTYVNKFTLRTSLYSSADRTLSNKKWTLSGDSGRKTYYKVVTSKAGYITVQSDSKNSINFMNSSKKSIHAYGTLLDSSNNLRATYAVKKGTYYIEIPYSYEDTYKLKYTFSSDKTLSNKKWTTFYPGYYKETTYFKFKAAKTGYIVAEVDNNSSGDITLCSSKKKSLSGSQWTSGSSGSTSNHVVYGVKKGTTYYLKFTGESDKVQIKYTLKSVKEKSGSKRSKAVNLKRKKAAKGIIIAGNKTADWYKVRLTKSRKLNITLKGSSNDCIRAKIYDSRGKAVLGGTTSIYKNKSGGTLESYRKMKGTYYIKIYRDNKKSSGNYSISWR